MADSESHNNTNTLTDQSGCLYTLVLCEVKLLFLSKASGGFHKITDNCFSSCQKRLSGRVNWYLFWSGNFFSSQAAQLLILQTGGVSTRPPSTVENTLNKYIIQLHSKHRKYLFNVSATRTTVAVIHRKKKFPYNTITLTTNQNK